MIYRPLLHVAGPPQSGKTTFIERFLDTEMALAICVRAQQVAELKSETETTPQRQLELRRYRESGASEAVLYRFPRPSTDAFYVSNVMTNYSEAVVFEGDCPVDGVDLTIFVAPAPRADESLLQRVSVDRVSRGGSPVEQLLGFADGEETLARFLAKQLGSTAGPSAFDRPDPIEEMLFGKKKKPGKSRGGRRPTGSKRWALSERYRGLERAQIVVINLRPEDDPQRAQDLCAEIARLRKDRPVFDDVIGLLGSRVPITTAVANLGEPPDVGLRKCFAKIKRTLRSVSE